MYHAVACNILEVMKWSIILQLRLWWLGTIPLGTSKAWVVKKKNGGTLWLVTVGSVINEYLISVF